MGTEREASLRAAPWNRVKRKGRKSAVTRFSSRHLSVSFLSLFFFFFFDYVALATRTCSFLLKKEREIQNKCGGNTRHKPTDKCRERPNGRVVCSLLVFFFFFFSLLSEVSELV